MRDEKYIFTPGPVKMHQSTLEIGRKQTPYFRNEWFSRLMFKCKERLLKFTNAPQGSEVIFLSTSGTGAMDAAVSNLLAQKNRALVINGGGFGQRFVEICENYAIDAEVYKANDSLFGFDLKTTSDTLLINAHETTVGRVYDLESIGQFCRENHLLNIVDAISLFVTDEIDMQKFNIDALIISSHKGLALPPGLSMVILSPNALKRSQGIDNRSYYLDFNRYLKDIKRGQTPFTPPVSIILQLTNRLYEIEKTTIEYEYQKTKEIAQYFRESIRYLPLKIFHNEMPNAMTTLVPTDGKSAAVIVNDLKERFNVIVTPSGGELRDKIFRVSHMGDMTKEYTDVLINALYQYYGERR